ncbi:hypothetical protein DQ384_08385 [Sphaerisporangium album]|uniref:DUF4245 domain-containing protein n=1 Tax=Sphaerisporangium album TaxID=509200 RepID=A0A367FMT6_9ACTN|nr:hypothetical protein [Sphaerisporangium album]RCG31581.1 hypothetical protein DQ384_08385 [Sphaerisporangium album]
MSRNEPLVMAEDAAPYEARRGRGRTKLIVLLASLVAVVAVASAFAVSSRPAFLDADTTTVAAEKAVATVDGVEVQFLPEYVGKAEAVTAKAGDLRGKGLRWRDKEGSRTVQVSVFHPRKVNNSNDILALNLMKAPVEPKKDGDPVVSQDGTDMLWMPKKGVLVRVTVSELAADDLEAIAKGVRVK